MSRKKGRWAADFATGIFMIAVLALLAYFTIVISGVDLVRGKKRIRADISFEQVGGLKEHDSVMYRGTKVGIVETITLSPSNLIVTVDIDESVRLREKYVITVCALSMLGGNYLVMDEGTGEIVDIQKNLLYGETPTDWMRDVKRIAQNLNELTSSGEIKSAITNFEAISVKARAIIERVERGEGSAGKFLSSDTSAYDNFDRTLANAATFSEELKHTVSNATEISERLKNGEGDLGKLLVKDGTLYAELRDAIASFKKACEGVDFGESKAGINEIVNGAKELVAKLNQVAERLEKGDGTLGKLIKDDTLHEEVKGLTKDVRQIIDNYRDTTPISTFSSLATGAL